MTDPADAPNDDGTPDGTPGPDDTTVRNTDSDSADREGTPDGVDTRDVEVVMVAAVAENGVIGRDGGMPWHYPEDLRRFKETTMGSPVVMGRRTFESIHDRLGEPLPGRTNVVLTTRDGDLPAGAIRAGSIAEAVAAARETGSGALYVIGGGSVYEQFLPLADRLVITEIHGTVEGDTYFPDVDRAAWRETDREDRAELSFVTYERRGGRG